MKLKALALLAALTTAAVAQAAKPIEVDLLLKGGTLVQVEQGRTRSGMNVLTRGDRIVAIVDDRQLARYKPRRVVDVRGRFVMPGLWDNHIHLGGAELVEDNRHLLPLYLAHGVTTVRDCAGDLTDTVFQWRDDIAAGRMQGPTIFMSGAKLEGYKPLWKGTIEVGTPQEVTQALDGLQARHADFVKITDNTLKPEIFIEALQQARQRGLRTSAHLPAAVTLAEAAEAGLGTVEHLSYVVRAGSPHEAELAAAVKAGQMTGRAAAEQSLAEFDEATARATYRKLAAAGTAVVPTLSVLRATAYLDQDDHAHDEFLSYLSPKFRATYDWRVQRAAQDGPAAIAYRHANVEKAASLLPVLAQEGVTIIAGTDAGWLNSFDYPGQSLHEELALYVRYGLTPQQALAASVLAGPRFLGKQAPYGDLAEGKAADILVLDADPLQDIAATRKIRAVMSHGRLMDRAELDRMLKETRAWAATQSL
ncbi:amidohydrolase family protein [Pelomonas sp. KK5]|uniref:amidohydrolase family protein n=1 Tax=Pelomonas sp. KK5 TaxID=1855730 RepID=UPI00097CA50A|nr:amidohydrolase family protein [Pelomonas sp. KK5]